MTQAAKVECVNAKGEGERANMKEETLTSVNASIFAFLIESPTCALLCCSLFPLKYSVSLRRRHFCLVFFTCTHRQLDTQWICNCFCD